MRRYLFSAACVINFDRIREIRLRAGEAEKAFAKLFNSQSQQTNIPDDLDANIPRLLFADAKKQLTISQQATQLNLSFERSASVTLESQLDIFEKHVKSLFEGFNKFLGKSLIRESATVLELHYPKNEELGILSQHLFERFVKIDPIGEVASFNLQLGFRTEDRYFLNFSVNGYELREKDFSPPLLVQERVPVNLDDLNIVERGYNLKIDINSRPQRLENDFSEVIAPQIILKKARHVVTSIADSFLGLSEPKEK